MWRTLGYNGRVPDHDFLTGDSRYNSYGAFLRTRFGCRVHKVIVDAGFTCPNRDGTVGLGGCTYCDNEAFRPPTADRHLPVKEQVERGIGFLRRRYPAQKFIAYFQPFTNTYATLEELAPLYESALDHPDVCGLAVGTRADCIDETKVAWFENLGHRTFVTLEYGMESIHDRTLRRINRGHDFRAFEDAVRLTRNHGVFVCAHIILGFPWETREEMLEMARAISDLGVNFVKLHHLHVVTGTALGQEYIERPFPLLSFDEYVDLVVLFLERLSPEVCVERLYGLAPEHRLLGPVWRKGRGEVRQAIERALAAKNTRQGRLFVGNPSNLQSL
jgi:radical SAM protein (TIGR01212 family)